MAASHRAIFSVNGKPVKGAACPPKPIERRIAVNDETIAKKAIAAEIQNHKAPRGQPRQAWNKAANALAIRALLLQEAERQNISANPKKTGPSRIEADEDALIRELLEQSIKVEKPSEREIRAEWARDPDRFTSPPLWGVSHILCACDPREDKEREQARQRAEKLTKRALDNPSAFALIARDHSDCPSKSSGGSLGQIGPGDTVPEFEAVLREMREGEVTKEPSLSRHGWHVISLDFVAKGEVLPFEAVKGKISEAMEKVAWARAARMFVQELTEKADIHGAELGSGHPNG